MTIKRIALFIALGSIIAGIIVCFWPVPCEDNPFIATCFNRFGQAIKGLFILVPGIVLLILIPIANSRHRILAMIGVVINFIIAAVIFIGSVYVMNFPTGSNTIDPLISITTAIEGVGFFCAGLSANIVTGREAFFN